MSEEDIVTIGEDGFGIEGSLIIYRKLAETYNLLKRAGVTKAGEVVAPIRQIELGR